MSEDHASLIELDDAPSSKRKRSSKEADVSDVVPIEIDATSCRTCGQLKPLNNDSTCERCFAVSAVLDGRDIEHALGAVATEAAANAAAKATGSMASGALRGVGFSTSDGYVDALARGVKAATAELYKETLRSQYRWGAERVAALPVVIIADAELPVGAGIVHTAEVAPGETPAWKLAIEEARARKRSTPLVSAPVTVDAEPVRLVHGQLVAGAAADGHGVLVGWTGEGDKTRAELLERAEVAGVPSEWLPDAKEPKVQLSRAVRVAAGTAYNCETEKKVDAQVVEAREWTSRWMLVSKVADGEQRAVGQKYGEIALVVTLYTDNPEPELVFDEQSNEELREIVRTEFEQRIAAQRYTAADITKWLKSTIKLHLDGVKYGGNW